MEKKKYRVSRWIFLSLSVLMNTFLILYSTLPSEITSKWNAFVTNIFVGIINNATQREVVQIPMTELSISLSNEESYKYNYIPGYEVDEIPLGSAKQIECFYEPENTTDKSIEYTTVNTDIVKLNPNGLTVSVVGLKEGTATIKAKNKLSGLEREASVKVVNTVAPTNFEISVDSSDIAIGEQQTIDFTIDGGNLGTNELINFRYYDIRKLVFSSSNELAAEVDNNGVIYPKGIGTSTITVTNPISGVEKAIDVNITSGTPISPYVDLRISGSNVCYDNDMILDQSSHKNHYQLSVFDGEVELNPEDFLWESSDELLVKVDKHGVMRGFRKTVSEDKAATITATSKLTGQSVDFVVTVKDQMPTSIYYSVVNGNKTTWNPKDYTTFIGEVLKINIGYTPNTSKKDVVVEITDTSLIECANQGSSLNVNIKSEGECYITVTSVINPELKFTLKFIILKAGAIGTDELDDVGLSVRKVVGHATLFAIAEVFTIIAIFMFLYEKKWWLPIVLSLGTELLLASISEIVQAFTPGRHGLVTDVLINFGGAVIGAVIVITITIIIRKIKRKRIDDNKPQSSLK